VILYNDINKAFSDFSRYIEKPLKDLPQTNGLSIEDLRLLKFSIVLKEYGEI